MSKIQRYKIEWITEDEPDEEWLDGEWIKHIAYANNHTEIRRIIQQAKTEQGFNLDIYVWNWNQYMLTNINEE